MSAVLRVLIVEDHEDDALLVLRELRKGGFEPIWERVQTDVALRQALTAQAWDVVISDYQLPGFNAPTALRILHESLIDLPFIVLSGTIGEATAVAMMKAGAHDYLMKDSLTRLPEAVRREVREANVRAEQRRAEARLQQTAKREQLVRTVTERIRRSLDLDDTLTATVTEVRQILQVDRVILFRLESREKSYIVQESVVPGCMPLLGRDIFDHCLQSNCATQYAQGRIHAINDIEDGSIQPCYVDFLKQFQVRANLVVPIIQPNGLWGLLIAHHCAEPRQWLEEEIQLLKQLADQVAIAIYQADLYHQAQLELAERQRAEAALQQLNQELEQRVQNRTEALRQQANQERLLRLIIQNIHRSLDVNEILSTVLAETRHTLQADRVAVYQFNPDWSGCFVAESVGKEWVPLVDPDVQPVWVDTYLQETEGGRYRNGESFTISDIYTVGLSQCHIDLLEQFQARAYAIAPIFVDDQLWGLLAAYQNSAPRDWLAWEIRLLQQIALQMAIALRQSRLYQAAQTQVKALEELSQLKDDFLSTVSHELRSPLSNIKMAIQMVELGIERHGLQDPQISRYLQILKEECAQELSLINDLLDLQRLEAGVEPLELESIDLNHWLPAIAEPFETRAQKQEQKFCINLPTGLPTLITDATGLKRVLTELLHNACKYTPPHAQIMMTVHVESATLTIQVSNTGVELAPEELPRLFEKFYRIPRVDRQNQGGTGLGLALVKRLLEHLNGSIQVESTNSQIHFTVQLPLSPPSVD